MGDTNTNYQQFSGNLSPYLGKNFSYGDLTSLNSQMGASAGNQPTFIQGGNIYQVKDNGNNTFSLQQIDTVANRQQLAAQQQYQAQAGSAVAGLQTGKANLGQQYADLLKTVTGEYQPLINQTTASAGAEEARRGLSPDSFLAQKQVQGALQPVYGAEAANAQQIGAGSIADVNTYNQAIASLQSGQAQFGATLPLQYGQLALQQAQNPAQIALAQAQAKAYNTQANNIPVGVGGMIFQPSTGNYNSPIQSVLKQLGINLIP